MDWPSGLGGVGGRGRASTHGAFSWVDGCKSSGTRQKNDFAFFWGREGGVPGRRRQRRELGGGGREVEGSGGGSGGGQGREREKSSNFECFWGRDGGVPGRWRQRPGMDWPSGLGGVGGRGRASTHGAFSRLQIVFFLNPTKTDFEFFLGREGGPGRGRQRRELGGGGS